MLRFFMDNRERVFTRGQLLENVWGNNVYVEERTVESIYADSERRWHLMATTN